MPYRTAINVVISLMRNFVTPEVWAAIKNACSEAVASMPDRGDGKRTQFVIAKCESILRATPNPYDDIFFGALVHLYLKKYA